jgi:hypothetical protein
MMRDNDYRVNDSIAYLSLRVPSALNAEHAPRHAPILLEVPGSSTAPIELRANGRYRAVPAGIVHLTARPGSAQAVTVEIELQPREAYHYRFKEEQFTDAPAKTFGLTTSGPALSNNQGLVFARLLEGPDLRPTQLTHVVRHTAEGGLAIWFAGTPHPPLMLEVMAPGHSRALLALAPKPGPGIYSTARLTLESVNAVVAITATDVDPDLASAWRSAVRGDFTESLRLIKPHLKLYAKEQPGIEITAAGVAYILIRGGQCSRLGSWALNLFASDRICADGLVIASEWFGNAGCHVTAMNLLRRLPNVGLPLFTDGYSLAVARLAAYATAAPRKRGVWHFREPPLRISETPKSDDTIWQMYGALLQKSESTIPPWIRGQELTSWDRDEARDVHQYLVKRIRDVDWSSFLLRASRRPRHALPPLFLFAYEWLEARLGPSWIPIQWQIPSSDTVSKEVKETKR